MRGRQRRLIFLFSLLLGTAGLAIVILTSFQENLLFFLTPTDIVNSSPSSQTLIRLGGVVEKGSLRKSADGTLSFRVRDKNYSIMVHYKGILPDLFREGQTIIAEGRMKAPLTLRASTILAKHDENYIPKGMAQ